MDNLRRGFQFAMLTLLLTLVSAGPAFAYTVAGLKVEFSDQVQSPLLEQLEEALAQVFADSTRHDWIPANQARGRLTPIVRDCFTEDCLQRAGSTLGAEVGLRVEFGVESQIYEWTVQFYDLTRGRALTQEQGTCEFCGRTEVLEQFQASIRGPLALLSLDESRPGPVETHIDVIEEGVAEIRISVVPDDTRIFIDDEPVGVGNVTIRLEEGSYEIRFSHDTHHGLRETLVITESSAPLMIFRVHLRRGQGRHRAVVTRGDGLMDNIEDRRNTYGLAAVGGGVILTVAGYFITRLHGQPTCGNVPVSQCPDLYNTAFMGTTITVIGALSIASGGVLLSWPWLAGTQGDPQPMALEVAPAVNRHFTGFSLRGRF